VSQRKTADCPNCLSGKASLLQLRCCV